MESCEELIYFNKTKSKRIYKKHSCDMAIPLEKYIIAKPGFYSIVNILSIDGGGG